MAYGRDLLGWWRINFNICPKLAKLARSDLTGIKSRSKDDTRLQVAD